VALCNPRHDPLPAGPFDLVVSLLSAGFHYPISEYSEFALRTLKPGGALVFDCRKNVDQQDFLSGFSEVNTISDDTKSVRIVAIK
jgi:hypothetical protein